MSDLNVVATIPAKPGFEKEVAAALSKLATATLDEPGCVSYVLYESVSTPGTFITIETWNSQADLDVHMKAPAITEALATAGEHIDGLAVHPLKLV